MLDIKEIEYGELLQRCACGVIDQDGFRFNVGNYVVVLSDKDTGHVYIAAVCITVSELRKRLVQLREDCEYWGEVVTTNVYHVVPTRVEDDEIEDDCQPSRFTVLVPYTEFPFREFYACLVAGVVADPYGFGGGLLRGDHVAVKRQDDEGAPYRIVNVYDFVDAESTMEILKEYVTDGARLLMLS